MRVLGLRAYRGTSLTRQRSPRGPYRRPMLRVLGESGRGTSLIRNRHPHKDHDMTLDRATGGSYGGGGFLMSEIPPL